MRVLQINSVCGIGSTGRIATDINEMLIQKGHESIIAYGRGASQNCDNVIRIGSDKDVYLHVIKTRFTDRHGFGSKDATVKLTQDIEIINPDIIHLHNIHGYYLNISVLFEFLKRYGKPVLWTLHDCWSFTGHCSHFDYIGCDKWMMICENCPQTREYPKSLFADKSSLNYLEKRDLFTGVENLKIITPSRWLETLVAKSFLNNYDVSTIYNGVDLDLFSYTESNFRSRYSISDKFIILGVANKWTDKKGLRYFHELAKKLSDDEMIVLVGVSEAQINNLPHNIIGIKNTGSITELSSIYSASDVYVNMTLEEVLGMTNIEALACGTPVITFNTGGSPECIERKTGYIVEKGSIEQVLYHISLIKKNKRSNYSIHCRNSVRIKFDKKDNYNKYVNEYLNLIK